MREGRGRTRDGKGGRRWRSTDCSSADVNEAFQSVGVGSRPTGNEDALSTGEERRSAASYNTAEHSRAQRREEVRTEWRPSEGSAICDEGQREGLKGGLR